MLLITKLPSVPARACFEYPVIGFRRSTSADGIGALVPSVIVPLSVPAPMDCANASPKHKAPRSRIVLAIPKTVIINPCQRYCQRPLQGCTAGSILNSVMPKILTSEAADDYLKAILELSGPAEA